MNQQSTTLMVPKPLTYYGTIRVQWPHTEQIVALPLTISNKGHLVADLSMLELEGFEIDWQFIHLLENEYGVELYTLKNQHACIFHDGWVY
jgi:hypothetical protein